MNIRFISHANQSRCQMKDCDHQGSHFLQIDHQFLHDSKKENHVHFEEKSGIISIFEVNLRQSPNMAAMIVGQLRLGELVVIEEEQKDWLFVKTNEKWGWVHTSCVTTVKVLKAKEQLQGETHKAVICLECLSKLNFERFYVDEIEPHLTQHVINNYLLSYTETAIALEEQYDETQEVPFEQLKERILDEISSGLHGEPIRLNEEAILNNYQTKRA